ncbi:MAG: SPOR domain-containing protein [Acidobacteriaceae bacterium]|nr:SPOR domain-containing protein [Acidobacteriaceae bacterium]
METRRHHLLDDDDDLIPGRDEREYTLSTGTILAIFFGLILVCGLFFAFGYNLGKKATVVPTATTGDGSGSNDAQFNHFNKPSAGSPTGSNSVPPAPSAAPAQVTPAPTASPSVTARDNSDATAAPVSTPVAAPRPTPVRVSTPAAQPAAPMPATSASGAYVVQVAAVSHREDADLLVGALHSKGYSVSARNVPQDSLLHIQVGPFANKKDADAMRQRLLGDGYNAIVK